MYFLFFLSTIVRQYVENNGEELIGRKVSIEDLHLNYAKVSVDIEKFVLYEKNETDTFRFLSMNFISIFNPGIY